MNLIRHCIVDKNTNLVVNVIECETVKSGIPDGLEQNLLCVQSDDGQIGATYSNGIIINPPEIIQSASLFPTSLA